jgi:hypothetical protein
MRVIYRPSSDGHSIILDLPEDKWDALHERLIAQGMCSPWSAKTNRLWRELLVRDAKRRRKGRK